MRIDPKDLLEEMGTVIGEVGREFDEKVAGVTAALAGAVARLDALEVGLIEKTEQAVVRHAGQAVDATRLELREVVVEGREILVTLKAQTEQLIGALTLRLDEIRDGQDGRDGADGVPGAPGAAGPVGPQGPRGETGERGADGVVPPFDGKWDRAKEYRLGDGVSWNGSGWIAKRRTIAGEEPGTCNAFAVHAERGKTGQAGAKGERGLRGEPGAAGPQGDRGPRGLGFIEVRAVGRHAVFVDEDGGTHEMDLSPLFRQVQAMIDRAMVRQG